MAESTGASSIRELCGRLGARRAPDDVAALLLELCSAIGGARRAMYLRVASGGRLDARFSLGLVVGSGLGLTPGEELTEAILEARTRHVDAGELSRWGVRAANGDAPLGVGLIIPLVGSTYSDMAETSLASSCSLATSRADPDQPCWLVGDGADAPPRAERLRELCPACPAFGPVGALVLEREERLEPADLERIRILVTVAGERIGALRALALERAAASSEGEGRTWLDAMMAAAADPIIVTDLDNAIVLKNQRAADLLVARPNDSPGRHRALTVNQLALSAFLSSFAIAPDRAPRELAMVDPTDGNDLLFEVISSPAFDAEGRIRTATVTVLRDVTDLQRASQELARQVQMVTRAERATRRERDRLDKLLRGVVEPIVVTNDANEIVLANAGGEHLLQDHPCDAVGDGEPAQAARKAVRTNDLRLSSYLTDFFADWASDNRRQALWLIDPATGEERNFEVTSSKIRDARGEPTTIVSVLHDVTELKELERRRVERALFESEKLAATGRLAASIAHEVNNPLESLKNSLFLLGSRLSSGPVELRQFLGIAQEECARVSRIVKQFLGYYQPSDAREAVNLASLLDQELTLLENQLRRNGIEVRRAYAGSNAAPHANADQLKQVFLNLLLNAIEAMPDGGTLTVSVRTSDRPSLLSAIAPFACVTIADTGPGIAPDVKRTLFEPFQTTKDERGTGLGLWVSHGIVKAHKGDIKVETQVGAGTHFHVVLPLQPVEETS